MSSELRDTLTAIQTMAGSISTIRGTSRGQPILGIPVTPWIAVFLSDGSSRPQTYGIVGETHDVTLRVYWDLKNPEVTEKALEDMWNKILQKFQEDFDLGGNVIYSDLTSYTTGYQDVSSVPYRILDVTISFTMATQSFAQ